MPWRSDLLNTARTNLQAAGKVFAIVSVSEDVPAAFEQHMHFSNIDAAMEYFEDRLLERAESVVTDAKVPLEEFDLLAGLDQEALKDPRQSPRNPQLCCRRNPHRAEQPRR